MLIEMVHSAERGDQDALLRLIEKFDPLIHKYGKKLQYEDAYEDLLADFIELVRSGRFEQLENTSDGAVVNYTAKSFYRMYLKRLKRMIETKVPVVHVDDMSPLQLDATLYRFCIYNDSRIQEYFPCRILTRKEKAVLICIYEHDMSVAEIAKHFHVTRQNVNQIKKRAISKLRKSLQLE